MRLSAPDSPAWADVGQPAGPCLSSVVSTRPPRYRVAVLVGVGRHHGGLWSHERLKALSSRRAAGVHVPPPAHVIRARPTYQHGVGRLGASQWVS